MPDIPRDAVEKLREGWLRALNRMENAARKDTPKTHETNIAFREGAIDILTCNIDDLTALLEANP